MSSRFGGRVLAGEDSEEDDDENEEMTFGVGGYGNSSLSASSSSQPKFSAPVMTEQGNEGDESESEEEKEESSVASDSHVETKVEAESSDVNPTSPRKNVEPSETNHLKPKRASAASEEWPIDGDDVSMESISAALVQRLRPTLDASIHRIAELTESQKQLHKQLEAQNKLVQGDEDLSRVIAVMNRLPHYLRKAQYLKTAMTETATSVDRMKRRAESLRIDAQSHAINKEDAKVSQSQWTKLAAKRATDVPPMSPVDTEEKQEQA